MVTRRSAEVVVIAEWISVGVAASGTPDICLLHIGSVTADSQFVALNLPDSAGCEQSGAHVEPREISRSPATRHDRLLTLMTIGWR